MAAPHVAGVAARWLSVQPSWSAANVWSQIDKDHTYVNFGWGHVGDPNKLLYVAPGSSTGTVDDCVDPSPIGQKIRDRYRPGNLVS